MKKFTKLALLTAMTSSLTACSWVPFLGDEEEATAVKPVPNLPYASPVVTSDSNRQAQAVVLPPKQTGIAQIRRHGKSFDIEVLLDATDDNVFFEMDLPKYSKNESDLMDSLVEETMGEDEEQAGEQDKDQTQKDQKQKQAELAKKDKEDQDVIEEALEPTPEAIAKSSRHILYAQTYFYEQNYDRAVSEVNQAIKLNPRSAVAYALKGSIHYKLNEMNKAKIAWKTALDIDPGVDNVRYMLEKLDQ